jgi:hypothetical protein
LDSNEFIEIFSGARLWSDPENWNVILIKEILWVFWVGIFLREESSLLIFSSHPS